MGDVDIQPFILFCEDVRRESGGKQTLLGVLGGSLFVDAGSKTVEKLKAVLIARITGTRSVHIAMGVKAYVDDRTVGPDEAYSATFSQDGDDRSEFWTLQLAADLAGMPLGKSNLLKVQFSIDDVETSAILPVFFGNGPSLWDSTVENEVGGQASPLPEPPKKRPRLRKNKDVV